MPRPDKVIAKRLREYDKLLFADFDHERERWLIKRKAASGYGPDETIMVVQNEDLSYRPLDDRVITQLIAADVWRYKDVHEMMRLLDEHNHQLEEGQRRRLADYRERVAREDLYRSFFGYKSVAPRGGWVIGNAT